MRQCTPSPAGSGPLPTLLLRRLCVAKSAALSRLRQELIPAAIEFERPPAVGTGRSPSRYPPDSLSRARSPNQVPEGELTKLFRGASLTLEVGGGGRLQDRAQARHSGSSSQSPHRVVTREPCPPQTHSSILSMMHSSILSTAPSPKPCESVSSNVSKLFPEPSIDRLPRVGVLRPFPSHGMGRNDTFMSKRTRRVVLGDLQVLSALLMEYHPWTSESSVGAVEARPAVSFMFNVSR